MSRNLKLPPTNVKKLFMRSNNTLTKVINQDADEVRNIKTPGSKRQTGLDALKQSEGLSNNAIKSIQLSNALNYLKGTFPNIETKISSQKVSDQFVNLNIENNLKEHINNLSKKEKLLTEHKNLKQDKVIKYNKQLDDYKLDIEILNNPDKYNLTNMQKDKFRKKLEEAGVSCKSLSLSPSKKKHREINTEGNKETETETERHYTKSQANLHGELSPKKVQNSLKEIYSTYLLRITNNSKEKVLSIQELIPKKFSKKKEAINLLNRINDKLKSIKKEKKDLIEILYYHYLTILRQGLDVRKEGLTWIIREIFDLKKTVLENFLPKFLDDNAIIYLFEITHLSLQKRKLEYLIEQSQSELMNDEVKLLGNKLTTQLKKASHNELSIKAIKEKFCNNNTSESLSFRGKEQPNRNQTQYFRRCSMRRKTKFDTLVEKKEKENDIRNIIYGDNIPSVIKLKDAQKLTGRSEFELPNGPKKVWNICNKLENELDNINALMEQKKKDEMDRIFWEFKKNKYAERFNVDKKTVIKALVGDEYFMQEYNRQKHLEKEYSNNLKKCQFHTKIEPNKRLVTFSKNPFFI